MGVPATGEVILVSFPFSDFSHSKVRPAVCLASAGRGDWVLCQITSNAYADPRAVPLTNPDFSTGGLRISSYARPGKLFTANESLFLRSVGVLRSPALTRVIDAVVDLLRPPATS